MLCDWDREREQIQSRLRQISRECASSSSNYQTLSIVSPPHATLQETKCKITLLHADADNYIRKTKTRDMPLFFLLRQDLICDDYIEYTEAAVWLGRKVSSQQKREVCGCQHGFDYTERKFWARGLYQPHLIFISSFGCFVCNFSCILIWTSIKYLFFSPPFLKVMFIHKLFGLANTAHTTYHILINIKGK